MNFGSPDSRRAAEFDAYRRELLQRSRTVAGEKRELWFTRLKELVEAMFPEAQANFRKPGLATRMFSAEVAMPGRDKMHLLDLAQELDDNWRAAHKGEALSGASCVYLDRLDAVWEWAVDIGDCYVTGHVKLRNFPFDGQREDRGRGHRSFKPEGDRPDRRSFKKPFDRDAGDRPPRRNPTYDRPRESSPEAPESPWRRPGPKPGGRGRGPASKGGPKPRRGAPGDGRPRRKPSDG